ncbi:hypothetical protein BGZ63DRAFT_416207 [Mariannaea sp. PMI_226]|nr:hypothetical protein BGZ63DRAFT_416207 [Mariannaea sp. PMI_226]
MGFTPNLIEMWVLYGVGSMMIAARAFVRTKLVGVRGYRVDDYLVWLAWMVYTTVTVIANVFIIVAQGKHTSLLTPEQRKAITAQESEAWSYGSKIFLAGFYSSAVVIWILKFNMLFFYQRLVDGHWVKRAIYPVMGLVAASAVAIILTFTLTCIPFHKLWQVYPDPGWLCTPRNKVTFYTVLGFNLLTDLFVLLIPIPIVLPLQITILHKIGLIMLFGLGIFCMLASILRVVLVFKLNQHGASAMWALREVFVAVFVGQAPMVFPILRRKFWQGVYSSNSGIGTHDSRGYEHHQLGTFSGRKPKDPYSVTQIVNNIADRSESQEEIIKHDDPAGSKAAYKTGFHRGETENTGLSEHRSNRPYERVP